MTNTKPDLPLCNRCNFRMIAQYEHNRLWCQGCGHVRTDAQALQLVAACREVDGRDFFPIGFNPRHYPSPTDSRVALLLEDATSHLEQGNKRAARLIAHELINIDHRLVPIYQILFLSSPSLVEKARHLASILTFEPGHEAARAALNKLTPTVGKNIKPSFFTVGDHQAEALDVDAEGRLEDCPMCAGHTLYHGQDRVECLSCGYVPKTTSQARGAERRKALRTSMAGAGDYHLLQEALMTRRFGRGKAWNIGLRVLSCHNCGSRLTLSGNMMTRQCAFCDSQHIVVQDAVGSFQEPDAVIPVQIEAAQAGQLLYEQVPDYLHVERTESVGVFLPYWSFREIGRTATYRDMLVPGSQRLSESVLRAILPYDLRHLRPYDQRYLARWSAEIYTVDVIQASLAAQSALSASLEYRLLLLPVWMTTLHLIGGLSYHGIVNAQTGEALVTRRVDFD